MTWLSKSQLAGKIRLKVRQSNTTLRIPHQIPLEACTSRDKCLEPPNLDIQSHTRSRVIGSTLRHKLKTHRELEEAVACHPRDEVAQSSASWVARNTTGGQSVRDWKTLL